ncbi:TPA: hypothetical protein PTV74_003225 [Clostridium botulinum]|nr:hypothetical protein [Clostridium botulinum]HDK7206380.1 hypothetical protein [Clostridium botulinum]HDK7210116.1 hypothetical protein [Clostridium botulinum]HDK7265565.1 hypothetical protein [Clostridium botulinum]HDK7269413.1 hypothetical protein [Clostridium botulinum]
MSISNKEINILKFAEKRIIEDIRKGLMNELHMNGRLYENKLDANPIAKNITTDEEILFMIESYVSWTIDRIISDSKNDI